MKISTKIGAYGPAVAAALAGVVATTASSDAQAGGKKHRAKGEYLAGDFHNHTTCSDGSTSVRTLTRQSLARLDWFIQVGHSGSGPRDCRVDDFLYFSSASEFSPGLWVNTLEDPATEIKGDFVDGSQRNGARVQRMWRWQMLQEFSLPQIISVREEPGNEQKDAALGLEWTLPGHEHTSTAIVTGQYDEVAPNADAMAHFEYCFGRPSDDTSGGGGQGWTCEISSEANDRLLDLFEGRPEAGTADYNSTLIAQGGVNTDDNGEHVKSTAAMLWMQENYPGDSFAVQAHIERQGGFVEGQDRGYNIEHIRDWNNVAPDVSIGFESEPGHQAQRNRGSYNPGRPTAGLTTYGGTGCYAAAEAAKAGHDFDGTPLDPARFLEGGDLEQIPDNAIVERVTLCRPGVRTMWDALLSEGRHYFYYASSDWHSRGSFGPLDFEADNDFWPGEFQENFTWVEEMRGADRDPAQRIVDGLRSGNNYTVQGQLIEDLSFEACTRKRGCATMGETLHVKAGERVTVRLRVRDPKGENRSPYQFNNPSLLQIGIERPINKPKLEHVDLIQGEITGPVPPHLKDGGVNPEYFEPLAPDTTRIVDTWEGRKTRRRMGYSFVAKTDSYVRARGTNIPAGTPNERDMYGNPLPDNLSDNIACDDPDCPPHLEGILDKDVEAWSDLSFHTNPIFIVVR